MMLEQLGEVTSIGENFVPKQLLSGVWLKGRNAALKVMQWLDADLITRGDSLIEY